MAAEPATSTEAFIQTLGVNTHIDFNNYGYQDLSTVESAIKYLGLTNLRDSPQSPADLTAWQQVAQATGAKFDAYIGETSPSGMSTDLSYMQQLAQEGVLNFMEGGNEEDDSYPASLGNTLQITAQFQQTLFDAAQSYGLPVINMSFGSGWTAANNWQGDYGDVGNLSGITDYGNGHVYPAGAPSSAITMINGLAKLAAASRPVIITEFGYDTNVTNQTQAAKWILDSAFDAIQDGDVKTYFYALFDDQSGDFGLMNSDGSPKPAGEAIHNLTTLLQDGGGPFTAGSLNYTLSNTAAGDNSFLMEKSDGSYWLALWNESNSGHTVTLNLASTASDIQVFDPLTGTTSTQSFGSTNTAQISVPDHPILVEIVPSGGQAPTTTTTTTTTTGTTTTTSNSGGGGTSDPSSSTSNGMSITAPTSVQGAAVTGVSISDPYALSAPDNVSVTITDQGGSVSTVDAFGNSQQGSSLTLSGTIWQVNAGLANLRATGGAALKLSATDQVGSQATATIALGSSGQGQTSSTAPAGTSTTSTTSTPTPPSDATTIVASDTDPLITTSNAAFSATAGDHMIFIAGTGDTLVATGGTETVQAYQGGNTITTGDGNDTIRFAGSGNTINAGGGNNQLADSGSSNTIVLPGAGQGTDNILGWVTQNGDTFDLRPALSQTGWNGNASTVGNYVQVTMSGTNALITIDPDGTSGAHGSLVATLNDASSYNLSLLLAHATT